jgi:MFS family permease
MLRRAMTPSRRNVAILAICQALLMTSGSLLVTTSALVGVGLAEHKALATLPIGLQFLATMLSTMPASLLMRRIGRRAGFAAGALIGLTGAGVCTAGIVAESLAVFGAGCFLIGIFNGVGQYYRFAAAEVADPGFRPRAISLVLAGGVVAAFTGPNLARLSREWVAAAEFAGSYASLVVLYLATLLLVSTLRIPPPGAEERGGHGRALSAIASDARFPVAVLGAMIAYGVMNVLMTATPLAMLDSGHAFSDTALAIQWHVLGMFAPAFFTGHLINRFGVLRVMMAGAVLLAGCVAVNLSGTAVTHFWVALALLGLGWNFLFVGSTTLLTEVYRPAEKAKVQGLNDLLVFATVACTATTSGTLHHALGWEPMNIGALPFVLVALVATTWLATRPPAEPRGI